MFDDFFKRMFSGFGGTMFLISLPLVMLVAGLMCYMLAERLDFTGAALRLGIGGAVIAAAAFAYSWNNFLNPKDKK